MPTGTVEAIGKSRSGKPTVTIGGQIYSASQCNPPTTNLRAGDKIEFDSASSQYNGATVWFLNSFRVTEAALPPPPAVQRPGEIAVPRASQNAQGGITEPERIFAYGVVTEAIKAGLVKEPEGIEKWVCAAKNALRSQGE